MEFDLFWLGVLFIAALMAGFVDSIAGGGGLISVMALASSPLPTELILGTNKLQSTFGSFTAMLNYKKKGLFEFKEVYKGVIFTAVGAICGTLSAIYVNVDFLDQFIPIMLGIVFIYMLFSPKLGEKDRHNILSQNAFYCIFGLSLGFYDGFFGPATGSFWTIAFIMLLGSQIKKATAKTKVMNFTSNIVALTLFIINAKVFWLAGLLMAVAQIIGAYLGSSFMVKKDTRFVRIFFLCVMGVSILKLLHDNFFKG